MANSAGGRGKGLGGQGDDEGHGRGLGGWREQRGRAGSGRTLGKDKVSGWTERQRDMSSKNGHDRAKVGRQYSRYCGVVVVVVFVVWNVRHRVTACHSYLGVHHPVCPQARTSEERLLQRQVQLDG